MCRCELCGKPSLSHFTSLHVGRKGIVRIVVVLVRGLKFYTLVEHQRAIIVYTYTVSVILMACESKECVVMHS